MTVDLPCLAFLLHPRDSLIIFFAPDFIASAVWRFKKQRRLLTKLIVSPMPDKTSSNLLPDLSTTMGVTIDASTCTTPIIMVDTAVDMPPPAAMKIFSIDYRATREITEVLNGSEYNLQFSLEEFKSMEFKKKKF
ncbi:hypothetical protein PUN28_004424 [Cardiocondyla obscurior]|uniref:Uncharacterized protein n=1 Tax=Cardiocondyla obscurior TaxID=286306 RepID=A0AAW2GGU2_9HYME